MRDNWKRMPLCKIAEVGAGNSAPQKKELFQNGIYPFVRTADVGKIRFGSISDSADKLNQKGISKLRLVPRGSILVPKSGASTFLNHRVILGRDSYVSSHLATVKANPDCVLDEYLLFFLLTIKAQDLIQDHKYPSLKLSDIKDIYVDTPPLPEQKRIVAILDQAFAGISKAVANTEKNLANARELFESYLNSVFSQTCVKWEKKKLSEITTKIGSGATPRGGQSAYKDNGISLIRSLNVHDRCFIEKRLAFIDDNQAKGLSNVIVESGDVLFNITGASIARCCVVPDSFLPARVNQHVAILRPSKKNIISDFLCYLMTSRVYKDHLLGAGNKGGSTRQAITKSLLQNLNIAIPCYTDQINIVDILKSIESETRRLESIYQRKHTALAELKQSLLQKAFSGELTAEKIENDLKEAVA